MVEEVIRKPPRESYIQTEVQRVRKDRFPGHGQRNSEKRKVGRRTGSAV